MSDTNNTEHTPDANTTNVKSSGKRSRAAAAAVAAASTVLSSSTPDTSAATQSVHSDSEAPVETKTKKARAESVATDKLAAAAAVSTTPGASTTPTPTPTPTTISTVGSVSSTHVKSEHPSTNADKIRSNFLMTHGDWTNFVKTLAPETIEGLTLKVLEKKTGRGVKALVMKGNEQLIITGPPMIVQNAFIHGVGLQPTTDTDRGNHAKCRYRMTLRTPFENELTKDAFRCTDYDRKLKDLIPEIEARAEAFYEGMNGPMFNRLLRLYFTNMTALRGKVMPYKKALDTPLLETEDGIESILNAMRKTPWHVLEACKTPVDKAAFGALNLLIDSNRADVNYWVNNGANKMYTNVVPDAKNGAHLVRFGAKVFYPTKSCTPESTKKLNAEVALHLVNWRTKQRANLQTKSETTADSDNLSAVPLLDAPQEMTTDQFANTDFVLEDDENPLEVPRQEVNIILGVYNPKNTGASYSYNQMRYRAPNGNVITRNRAVASDRVIQRGDYVAPRFAMSITDVNNSVFLHLELREVYIIAQVPHADKNQEVEIPKLLLDN